MFKLLKKFDLKDYLSILLIIGFVVLQVWLDLTMPDYTSKLVGKIELGITMEDVWSNGGMMLLCAFGSMLSSFACSFVCVRLASKTSKKLRSDIYNKISSFSNVELKKFSTPSLITRTTNDIGQVQGFISMGLQILIKAPILAIWAITKISSTSVEWTMATLITVLILVVIVATIVIIVLPKFKKIQTQIDNLNNSMRENVSGIRVVRAFNAEQYQEQKFKKSNEELTNNQLFTSKMTGLFSPVMTLCMNGLMLAIYWIGAILLNKVQSGNLLELVDERSIIIANMMAFTQYALQVVMAFIMLIVIFVLLPRCIVSVKRINEVLDTKCSIIDGKEKDTNGICGEVVFKDVSFAYSDKQNEVISNISFEAKKGETVAIIGATGCGKTTLINLIPRFCDVTKGEVLVDGINVKDYDGEILRDKIAVVSQKACLFKGDIKSNITYGSNDKKVDEEKIKQALEISQSKFVSELDAGICSEVAQGGANFSGGQKQRISIARAIYKDAEIIIFDDSFSALDYKTDMLVRKAIKQNLKDKTIFIVAQRIGTIKNADKIIVLENGKIVGLGKHNDLLKNCPTYKEIALSQLNKEEL